MPRAAPIGALGRATGGVAWALLARGGRAAAPQYVTESVDRGPVTATVTATGVVEPIVTVQVGTYVSGPIRALFADFNSKVERGQVVARAPTSSASV
jgi:HlyD family secretion protein